MIYLPLRTRTPGNGRRHWRADWKEAKEQRTVARVAIAAEKQKPPFPVTVILTRLSPRKLDRQNIPGALKHVIDGIADAYGVDDGDDGWEFVFRQEIDKKHGVAVMLLPREDK